MPIFWQSESKKGYTSKSIPDKEVDKKMLGLIKGGKSIFTTRGKDRYAFAERLIGHAMNLENAIKESQKSKEQKEAQKAKMKDVQNKEMKENVVTDVKPKVQPKETKKQRNRKHRNCRKKKWKWMTFGNCNVISLYIYK